VKKDKGMAILMNKEDLTSTARHGPIIDVHHHILPDGYIEDLNHRGINKSFGLEFPKWSIDKALATMDKAGIQTAVTSVSAPGVYFGDIEAAKRLSRIINDFGSELISRYPTRFGHFATLPLPDIDGSLREIEYALDTLKLDGVILFTHYNERYLGDPYYEDVYRELNKRKTIVFIHPDAPKGIEFTNIGLPPSTFEVVHDTTRAVVNLVYQEVIKKYPNIKFILSHAGGTIPYIAFRISLPDPERILTDLKSFYYDTALSTSPYCFNSLAELVYDTHILFGSDSPFANAVLDSSIKGIRNYRGFTELAKEKIFYQNSVKIFSSFI
jgi:predicted TIM-barrel fold metal-dependent hydrolase